MADEGPPQGWTPTPDPTILTTEALMREIGGLKDMLLAQLAVAQQVTDSVRRESSTAVQHLRELTELQDSCAREVQDERVKLLDERKASAEKAIQDALNAAKEAVGKTEERTDKQIDSIKTLIESVQQGLGEKIDAVKVGYERLESRTQGMGAGSEREQRRQQATFGVIGIALAVAAYIAGNSGVG